MSFNLIYRKNKLKSKNFIPTIKYFDEEEVEEYVYPIGECYEEKKEDLLIEDEEEEQPQTILLLEELLKEIKKMRSVRRLELWVSKNKERIKSLNDGDRTEFLDYVNDKFYVKK